MPKWDNRCKYKGAYTSWDVILVEYCSLFSALMILRDCDNFEEVKAEMAELVHEQNLQTTEVCYGHILLATSVALWRGSFN